jgi:hypothetical protein
MPRLWINSEGNIMPAYTVPELSEMALAQIPAAVRGMARRKLARREKKLELTACLCSEFEFFEQQLNLEMAADSSADMLSVAVGIDPENLQAILDAIIKFLTDIAPLIKLFIDLLTVVLIVLALSAPASAQTVWWGDGPGGYRDGWYTHPPCNNDGTNGKKMCLMCWGPDGIAARQERARQLSAEAMQNVRYVSQPASGASSEMEAYAVQVPVTKQVQRCRSVGLFGRQKQCYMETVTVMETQTRYRPRVAARAAWLQSRAVNAMRKVAYTIQVPVTKRVCIGKDSQGRCIFGNVTTMETRTEYRMEPVEAPKQTTPEEKAAAQAPTPFDAVAAMIKLIQPTAGDVVYDLGSGDGRVLVAATVGGAKAVGIEIDPDKVADSRTMASVFGVQDKIKVYEGDILDYDLEQCRLVTMYLYPELMEAVAEKLPPGCKVWSYMHGLPGATKHEVDGYEFYEWTKA